MRCQTAAPSASPVLKEFVSSASRTRRSVVAMLVNKRLGGAPDVGTMVHC
jgi:hypothetical protein